MGRVRAVSPSQLRPPGTPSCKKVKAIGARLGGLVGFTGKDFMAYSRGLEPAIFLFPECFAPFWLRSVPADLL